MPGKSNYNYLADHEWRRNLYRVTDTNPVIRNSQHPSYDAQLVAFHDFWQEARTSSLLPGTDLFTGRDTSYGHALNQEVKQVLQLAWPGGDATLRLRQRVYRFMRDESEENKQKLMAHIMELGGGPRKEDESKRKKTMRRDEDATYRAHQTHDTEQCTAQQTHQKRRISRTACVDVDQTASPSYPTLPRPASFASHRSRDLNALQPRVEDETEQEAAAHIQSPTLGCEAWEWPSVTVPAPPQLLFQTKKKTQRSLSRQRCPEHYEDNVGRDNVTRFQTRNNGRNDSFEDWYRHREANMTANPQQLSETDDDEDVSPGFRLSGGTAAPGTGRQQSHKRLRPISRRPFYEHLRPVPRKQSYENLRPKPRRSYLEPPYSPSLLDRMTGFSWFRIQDLKNYSSSSLSSTPATSSQSQSPRSFRYDSVSSTDSHSYLDSPSSPSSFYLTSPTGLPSHLDIFLFALFDYLFLALHILLLKVPIAIISTVCTALKLLFLGALCLLCYLLWWLKLFLSLPGWVTWYWTIEVQGRGWDRWVFRGLVCGPLMYWSVDWAELWWRLVWEPLVADRGFYVL